MDFMVRCPRISSPNFLRNNNTNIRCICKACNRLRVELNEHLHRSVPLFFFFSLYVVYPYPMFNDLLCECRVKQMQIASLPQASASGWLDNLMTDRR
jgi:hypothetical protein